MPKTDGLAPRADVVVDPKVEGADVEPKVEGGCPNTVVVVPLPKAGVVVAEVDDRLVEESLDPRENADAGIAPNGDAPNDVLGLLNAEAPPKPHVLVPIPNALPDPELPPKVVPPNVEV